MLFQLVHPLGELHERVAQALDLLIGERPGLHPVKRLPLHQLPQELDERQHELREAALHSLSVDGHAPRQRGRHRGHFALGCEHLRHAAASAKLAGAHGPVHTRLSSGCSAP